MIATMDISVYQSSQYAPCAFLPMDTDEPVLKEYIPQVLARVNKLTVCCRGLKASSNIS